MNLTTFVTWAEQNGYRREPSPPKATYEVLRLRAIQGGAPILFHRSNRSPVLITTAEGKQLLAAWQGRAPLPAPAPSAMRVTIYTDAGFRAGRGAWAAWCRSHLGRLATPTRSLLRCADSLLISGSTSKLVG